MVLPLAVPIDWNWTGAIFKEDWIYGGLETGFESKQPDGVLLTSLTILISKFRMWIRHIIYTPSRELFCWRR